MTRRKFNSADEQRIIKMYQSGLSSIKIAKMLKCDKSVILGILKRNGVSRRNNKVLSAAQEKRVVLLHQAGRQMQDIAAAFGIHPVTVANILKRQGAKRKISGRHGNCKLVPAEEEQIVRINQAGHAVVDIANAYGLGHVAVDGAIKRQGEKAKRDIPFSKAQIAKIAQDYRLGLSINQLSRQHGTSHKPIRKLLADQKMEIRPNRQHWFNWRAFDALDNEHALYWLGFIYADGNVNRNTFRFGLSKKDATHLKKFSAFMQSDIKPTIKKNVATIEFHHINLANRLRQLGITVNRGKFHLLESNISFDLRYHFVRGYLDGDGCLAKDERVIFLGQLDILTWIKNTLVSDANASSKVKLRNRGNILEIAWGGRLQARRITDCIYKDATVWLERKRKILDLWN